MLMKQMLYLFMTLLFQQLSHAQAKQLADLEIDGKMHQRWYLCKDMSVLLKPSEAEISDKCYKWYGKPFQGVYAFIKDSYSLNCTPNVTYFYKCERYPDETCGSGTPEAVWYFKVLVIEGIKIWYLGLNNEVMMDQKSNPPFTAPDIETMDEYSDYVIQGDLVGVNLVDFDLRDSIVSLSLTTDIGQIIPGAKMPARTSQFGYKGIIPQVQQDGISKQYNLKIQAKICNFESNVIDISVKRLWIEKFQHEKAPHNFKIVLDDDIHFSANATNKCSSFKWNFTKFWKEPENNTGISGTQMIINPRKVKEIITNQSLGDTYGNLILQCKFRGQDLKVALSPIRITIPFINFHVDLIRFQQENLKVKVFFHKHDIHFSNYKDPSTSILIPNWFRYWVGGGCAHHLWDFGNKIYNKNSDPKFIYYAYTSWYIANTLPPTNVNDLTIFDEATFHDPESGAWGIHAFNAVIWHEYEHVAIKNEQWPGNIYDSSLDVDNDYYNDNWEKSKKGRSLGFKVRNISDDLMDKYVPGSNSNGEIYEEKRCRDLQKLKYMNGECNNYDNIDWSYERDVNKANAQGKNWSK
jgi:hypothetical protein